MPSKRLRASGCADERRHPRRPTSLSVSSIFSMGWMMTKLLAMSVASLLTGLGSAAWAQNGTMMNGGMGDNGWMGGYGGYAVPVLLAVVVGLVGWIVMQKRK
jgi:hypothetical protein